jgi:hypothetical protein
MPAPTFRRSGLRRHYIKVAPQEQCIALPSPQVPDAGPGVGAQLRINGQIISLAPSIEAEIRLHDTGRMRAGSWPNRVGLCERHIGAEIWATLAT